MLQQIRNLKSNDEIPMKLISKKLKVSYDKIRKICNSGIMDADIAFQKYKKRVSFKRLH